MSRNKKETFSYYNALGRRSAFYAIKHTNILERFRLMLYFIVSLLGHIFLFTRPLFAVADNNIARMMNTNYNFSIIKAFDGAFDKDKYFQLLGAYTVIDFAILVTAFLFNLPALVFNGGFDLFYVSADPLSLFLFVPFWVIGLVIISVFWVRYLPMGYVASVTKGLNGSDYLYNAKHCLDRKGHNKIFGVTVLTYLVMILYYGAVIGGSICLIGQVSKFIYMFLIVIVMVILIFISVFFVPALYFGKNASIFAICQENMKLHKFVLVTPNSQGDTYSPLLNNESVEVEKKVE